jgi:nucleoside-diphosphate-sugar epimerase
MTNWQQLHGDFFKGSRLLVTGGAGFIGSHLVDALVQLGAAVIVLDDMSGGDEANLAAARGKIEFIGGSILDESIVANVVSGCQFVFHEAAKVSVPASVAAPKLYEQINITGTFNVLDAARLAKVSRIMFAASSSAYGESEVLPKVETMPVLPQSPYAANKVAGEAILRAYARSYEVDTVSLRYFNIFGPRQNANSAYAGVIAAFAKKLLKGEPPLITGDGTASRDFTFVDNAVHANLLAARSALHLNGEVFNVATARRCTIKELAEKMAAAVGRADLKPVYAPPRPGDVMHSLADLSKISSALGYEPIVGFEEGLKATVEWYRAQHRSL